MKEKKNRVSNCVKIVEKANMRKDSKAKNKNEVKKEGIKDSKSDRKEEKDDLIEE